MRGFIMTSLLVATSLATQVGCEDHGYYEKYNNMQEKYEQMNEKYEQAQRQLAKVQQELVDEREAIRAIYAED
jgi:septal ring factor EnvC (AmiA/AmiB activator)